MGFYYSVLEGLDAFQRIFLTSTLLDPVLQHFTIILIGDSLGMVVMGMEGTVEVTMEPMIHHIKALVRGCKGPLIIGDMPFMSYHIAVGEAIYNAGRLVKEAGCEVIKLEGGVDFAPTIEAIVRAGIPVMGHIGLTPQTASALGGFKIQGRDATAAKQIIDNAKAIEDAGVFSIILEAVPAPLGKLISDRVKVPVIGIGAGSDVDGQVLVFHDVVGLFDRFVPKFVKQYANVRKIMLDALTAYKQEVEAVKFPGPEHSFKMPAEALKQLKKMISE